MEVYFVTFDIFTICTICSFLTVFEYNLFCTNSDHNWVFFTEDYVRFSHGLISDYLSEELSIALREHMG
jgi:hypothetical protein